MDAQEKQQGLNEVVIRKVEVRDSAIERGEAKLLHIGIR